MVKPDLSAKREKEINRQNELLQKKAPTASEQKELNILLEKYGEVVENAWDIIDGGCSWYCGGGNYKIKASSSLGDSYKAEFANDLSYKTTWVEGKKMRASANIWSIISKMTALGLRKLLFLMDI